MLENYSAAKSAPEDSGTNDVVSSANMNRQAVV